MALNEKQKRFCKEYVIDLNGKQAAIRAGYAEKSAEVKASQLLRLVKVQEYVAKLQGKITNKLEITAERVLQEYAKIGFADIKDFLSFNENGVRFHNSEDVDGTVINEVTSEKTITQGGSGDNAWTNEKVKFRMKLHSKVDALEKLARHLKLLNDGSPLSEDYINKLKALVDKESIENTI